MAGPLSSRAGHYALCRLYHGLFLRDHDYATGFRVRAARDSISRMRSQCCLPMIQGLKVATLPLLRLAEVDSSPPVFAFKTSLQSASTFAMPLTPASFHFRKTGSKVPQSLCAPSLLAACIDNGRSSIVPRTVCQSVCFSAISVFGLAGRPLDLARSSSSSSLHFARPALSCSSVVSRLSARTFILLIVTLASISS